MSRATALLLSVGFAVGTALGQAAAGDPGREAFDRAFSGHDQTVDVSISSPPWQAEQDRASQRVNTWIVAGSIFAAGSAIGLGLFFGLRKPRGLIEPPQNERLGDQ